MENSAAPNDHDNETGTDFVDETETTGVFLNQKEVKFFAAVKKGNIDLVRTMLTDADNRVNRDAINSNGKNAFQISVENDNIDMIKQLLDDIEETELYFVLSQCVVANSLDCLRKIISALPKELRKENVIIELMNEAAQLKHHEIVYFFIQNGYLIEDNHECACSRCETEGKERGCDEHLCITGIHRSQVAISRFKGLTSPVYMCLR
jgi:hypothetical protein